MAISREFSEAEGTVQCFYENWPITPKMKVNDPKELLDGFSQALEAAYQKIRDFPIK